MTPPSTALVALAQAMRRPGDEAQWTQVIAAVASADSQFAGRLAAVILDSVSSDNVRNFAVPDELNCVAEEWLPLTESGSLGRADLVFRDGDGRFKLIVELKLHSDYGKEQLARYVQALGLEPKGVKTGLVAITKTGSSAVEPPVESESIWLGSTRWWKIYDELFAISATDKYVTAAWRAVLRAMRDQGDFGPMDFRTDVLDAWARRDEAEILIRALLGEVAKPFLKDLRNVVGNSPDDEAAARLLFRGAGGTQPIHPWKNNINLQYAVPASASECNLRVQFVANGGAPCFTVECRYDHPKEEVLGDEAVARITEAVVARGIEFGNDGYGWYWASVQPTAAILDGGATVDNMLNASRSATQIFHESGLFSALNRHRPTTPATVPPPDESLEPDSP